MCIHDWTRKLPQIKTNIDKAIANTVSLMMHLIQYCSKLKLYAIQRLILIKNELKRFCKFGALVNILECLSKMQDGEVIRCEQNDDLWPTTVYQ